MASNKIKGITIQIGAETTGVNEALKGINKSINSTKSELRDVDKLLKLDPTNTTLLAQKQKLLSDAINQTKNKLETLKDAYQKGLNDETIDKNTKEWRNLEREIAKAEESLKGYQDQQNKLDGSKIGDSFDTSKITEGLDKASSSALNFGDILKANIGGNLITGGITTLTNAFINLGKSIANTVVDSGKWADDINTMAKQYNLSTAELQAFSRASELIDVELSTVTKSMSKLTKNMSSSSEGIVSAFQKLGVATKNADGSLRDSNKVFFETISALSKITDETEQDSIALTVFGKSAAELGTLINGGAEELEALTKAMEKNGLILNQKELNSLNKINDSFDKMNLTVDAFKDKMVSKLAPTIQPILDGWVESTERFVNIFVDGTFEEAESLKKLNDAMVESITLSEQQYQNSLLQYDLGLAEAIRLDEYIEKYKDANKTEEEAYWLKNRLKDGVDNLNESLGQTYYHWDEEKQAIVDINGNVVQLTESYKNLANESKKAMWLEANKQAYQDAIDGLEQVQTTQKEAYDKYAEALAKTGDKSKEALDIINNNMSEFNSAFYQQDTEAQKDITERLGLSNWEQARDIIYQLSDAQQNLKNTIEQGSIDTDMFQKFIDGYESVSASESDVAVKMIENYKAGFDFADQLTNEHIPMLVQKMTDLKGQVDRNMQDSTLASSELIRQQNENMLNEFNNYDKTLQELTGLSYEKYMEIQQKAQESTAEQSQATVEGNKEVVDTVAQDSSDSIDVMEEKINTSLDNTKTGVDNTINGEGGVKPTLLAFQTWWKGVNLDKTIKITVDASALEGYGGSSAFKVGGSGGFGINSGGFGVTLHNTINVNNNGKAITQSDVSSWGKSIVDLLDKELGDRL